jgi:outer membrane biosynthesis protein TonB
MIRTRTAAALILACLILISISVPLVSAAGETFTISATAGPGGEISPPGEYTAYKGEDVYYAIIADRDNNYAVQDVKVDGKSIGLQTAYSFSDVKSDHTISATFYQLTGGISVDSIPSGARFLLDGSYIAQTPLTVSSIVIGQHSFTVELAGYQTYHGDVMVRQDETTVVPTLHLDPIPTSPTPTPTSPTPTPTSPTPTPTPTASPTPTATATATSKPTTSATTTATPTPTSPTPTPTPTATTASPTPTSTTIPFTSPTPTSTTTTGTLTITSNPSGAKVYVNDIYRGLSPVTLQSMAPGSYDVLLELEDYSDWQSTVEVTAGQPTTVSAIFTPATIATITVTITPTTSRTPTATGTTAVSFTTLPTGTSATDTSGNGTPFATSPPTPPGATSLFPTIEDSILAGIVLIGLCGLFLAYDLLNGKRARLPLTREQKIVGSTGYLLSGAAVLYLLYYYLRSTPLPRFPAIDLLAAISFYLVISILVLIGASLAERPLRWIVRGHIGLGIAACATGLIAITSPELTNYIPVAFGVAGAVVSASLAQWQFRTFTPGEWAAQPGATTLPPSDPSPGSRTTELFPSELSERYDQVKFIGMGGIARVFRARNWRTGETVALKIPINRDENTGKCFTKEIVVWEGLPHNNIVKVSEVNILPVPYVEMEYVESALSDMKKPLPVRDATEIILGVARGLSFAHSKGIIHRDIKPHNILIAKDGTPKITDWGMSKVLGTCVVPTITGFSLSYAAPEQVASTGYGPTDQRTDIYQLGAVFYELVTGKVLYEGEEIGKVSARILSEEPVPPSALNPTAAGLDPIILKCLQKQPADRYQTVDELIEDLNRYLGSQGNYEIFDD